MSFAGDRNGTLATDRRYTGQRSFESSLGSLYHYQARWYSPVLGRFLSPDPIVPEPGNPQALNRYSYVYNNPYVYVDPSGYDPLDQAWRDSFSQQYGRQAEWYDEMIRLYSIAGFGDESEFYNDRGVLREEGILREIFEDPPAGRNWGQMPEALNRLAQHYGPGESRQFVRDVATLFAGLLTRSEASDRWALERRIVYPHVYLAADDSLDARLLDGDKGRNVHHWAAYLLVGYEARLAVLASIHNTRREIIQAVVALESYRGVLATNMADVAIGHAAARMGSMIRLRDALPFVGYQDVGTMLRSELWMR